MWRSAEGSLHHQFLPSAAMLYTTLLKLSYVRISFCLCLGYFLKISLSVYVGSSGLVFMLVMLCTIYY